jgi:hypothetical protein
MNAMWIPNDQVPEMTVESRIARFESDLGHVKKDVAQISENVGKLQEGLAAANRATADLRTDLAVAKGELGKEISAINATLPHFATKADLNEAIRGLESQMIRWFIFTSLGAGSLAFTTAKFVN